MTNREIAKEVLRGDVCLHCVHLGTLLFSRLWTHFILKATSGDDSAIDTYRNLSAKLLAALATQRREEVAKIALLVDEWEQNRGQFLDLIPRESLEKFTEQLKSEIATMNSEEK